MGEERRAVALSRRPLDLFLVSFLLINIPVVVLFESQPLLPATLVPKQVRELTQSYVKFSGDYLVATQPPFFKGLVYMEVLLQLPLLILNCYAFIAGKHPITPSSFHLGFEENRREKISGAAFDF